MLPSRWWAELASTDFAGVKMAGQIVVLPVAATEQHGPHLPLGTDQFIMDGYLARVLARLPESQPALFLPVQTIGCSLEHADFAGTLSLTAQTALGVWSELLDNVAGAGCRKVVIVSSHGGNSGVVDILARETRVRRKMFVVQAAWKRFGYPEGLFDEAEITHGIHGGQIETSLMLAFRPDLVRMDQARLFASASAVFERDQAWLRVTGRPTGFGWLAQDLNAAGVVGNAVAATAAAGEAAATFGADAFVTLLRDVKHFDLARLAMTGAGA